MTKKRRKRRKKKRRKKDEKKDSSDQTASPLSIKRTQPEVVNNLPVSNNSQVLTPPNKQTTPQRVNPQERSATLSVPNSQRPTSPSSDRRPTSPPAKQTVSLPPVKQPISVPPVKQPISVPPVKQPTSPPPVRQPSTNIRVPLPARVPVPNRTGAPQYETTGNQSMSPGRGRPLPGTNPTPKDLSPPQTLQKDYHSSQTTESTKVYPYEQIKNKVGIEALDSTKLESYLSDEEFTKVLGCNRDAFYQMPIWKQNNKKRILNLL